MQSSDVKKRGAAGGTAPGSDAKSRGMRSGSSLKQVCDSEVLTLEEELQENPELVYDPLKIRKMLLVKIGQLGETIKRVQLMNF